MVFKTLDDLIRHYKRKNQGLVMHLRHSVKRKTDLLIQPRRPPEDPEEEDKQRMFEEASDYESASYT